jgi:hypothetical protein
MHAKFLKYGVAPDPPVASRTAEHPAWEDPVQSIRDPAWPDIETAIRRLDGRRYRHLQLWPTDDERQHDPNPGSHDFLTIIGGKGAYVVEVSFSDGSQSFLQGPGPPNRLVIVLPDPSDYVDGAWTEAACRVSRDIEVVVQAVRHYAEQGRLDPSLNWETLTQL